MREIRDDDPSIARCWICRSPLSYVEATERECSSCRDREISQEIAHELRQGTGLQVRWQDVKYGGKLYALRCARARKTHWLSLSSGGGG